MKEYHKIQTVYKRDPKTNMKTLLDGEFSLPVFEYLKNNEWVFTEKVDGTNIRVMWDGKNVLFGGKTDNAQIPSTLVTVLNNQFMTIDKRKMFEEKFQGSNVCLYGEGYGAGIQRGGNYISNGVDFVLFDVKIEEWWLERNNVEDIANYFGIKIVPIIGTGTLLEMVEKTRAGVKSIWGDFVAEGIVARPSVGLVARNGDRIITKIKHKDFNPPKD